MKFRLFLWLFFPALGLMGCSNNLSSDTIVEATSPDQNLAVEVISGIPASSFGPHPVRVYVSSENQRDLLIRTPVFNDGKPLKEENAIVTFEGTTVSVCLLGAIPPGKLVTFDTSSKDYKVQEGSCGE